MYKTYSLELQFFSETCLLNERQGLEKEANSQYSHYTYEFLMPEEPCNQGRSQKERKAEK